MPGSLELLHFNPLTFCFAFAVFSSLLLILSAKVWKPVLKALDDRDDAIRGEMDRANESKLEAEKLLAEQKLAMNQLREEGRCMREEAMSLAEKQKAELLATAQHEAEQLAAKARADIQQEKNQMFEDVKSLAVEIGVDLASKILAKEMDSKSHVVAIKDSLSQLELAYKKAV
jgi:F-type H+-transporting ATPase subunit b